MPSVIIVIDGELSVAYLAVYDKHNMEAQFSGTKHYHLVIRNTAHCESDGWILRPPYKGVVKIPLWKLWRLLYCCFHPRPVILINGRRSGTPIVFIRRNGELSPVSASQAVSGIAPHDMPLPPRGAESPVFLFAERHRATLAYMHKVGTSLDAARRRNQMLVIACDLVSRLARPRNYRTSVEFVIDSDYEYDA
jgi:hypothetical protein